MDFAKLIPASNTLVNFLDLNTDVAATRGLRFAMGLMLKRAYDRGFVGCFCQQEGPDWARKIEKYEADRFRRENGPHSCLLDQIGDKLQDGSGKRSPPLGLAQRFDPRSLRGSQDFGNCTAFSLRELLNMLKALRIAIAKRVLRFGDAYGTATIYGGRGHGGQGMALSTAANIVSHWGANMRAVYLDGRYDFRNEDRDESYGNSWGSSGTPRDLLEACKAEGTVTKVGSLPRLDKKMLKDLLYSGVMIHHGGTLTWSRSGDPLCSLTGVGLHAQGTLGCDDTDEARKHCNLPDDEFVVFGNQTWGDYYSISRWLEEPWWQYVPGIAPHTATDALRIINQGSYGYYTLDGLKPSDLDWSDVVSGTN